MHLRRTYMVEPRFQRSFLTYTLLLGMACLACFLALNAYFLHELRAMGLDAKLPAYHTYFALVDYQQRRLWMLFGIGGAAVIGFTLTYGLWMSNRIAGPIYRLRRHLADLRRGRTEPIAFRRGDYFSDLADDLNALQQTSRSEEKNRSA